jgi:hypothetical protein
MMEMSFTVLLSEDFLDFVNDGIGAKRLGDNVKDMCSYLLRLSVCLT